MGDNMAWPPTPSDYNFGVPAPAIATPEMVAPAMGGASNPVGSYIQSGANPVSSQSPGWPTMSKPGFLAGLTNIGGGGLGFNLDTAGLALGGLQTIGSLWSAWNANKMTKEQFKFTKDFANTNLANQISSYNTALEDRGRARAFTEGQSPAEAAAYIEKNRLPERVIG